MGPLRLGRGVRTLMAAPLRVGPRTVGVVQTDWLAPRPLGQDEIDLIGLAAGRIALAVDRAQAYEAEHDARLRLELLARTSDVLGESLDFRAALGSLTHLIVPHLADWCAVDLVEPDRSHRTWVAHSDPAKVDLARELVRRYPADPEAAAGASGLRTNDAEAPSPVPAAFQEAGDDEEHRAILRGLDVRSAIVTPLTARGRTHGTLTLVTAESGRTYGPDDAAFATELARRAATAIDTARLYQDRDQVARTLQRSLLPPDLPDVPGIELAAVYHPAGGGGDVGGDFYDAFETGESGLFLAIGDVCGKGAPAAALTGHRPPHRARGGRARALAPGDPADAEPGPPAADDRAPLLHGRGRPAGGARRRGAADGLLRRPPAAAPRPQRRHRRGSRHPGYAPRHLREGAALRSQRRPAPRRRGRVPHRRRDRGAARGAHVRRGAPGRSCCGSSAGLSAAGIADRIERAVLEFKPGPPADDVAVIVLRLTGND